jgi:hypothetical protein
MKNIKLVKQILAVCFMLTLNTAFAQQDSLKNFDSLENKGDKSLDNTYYVENCEFSYFDSVTFTNSVSGIKSRQLSEISFDNVSKITFKNYNYLELLNMSGKSVSVNLKDANEVNIKKGNYTLTAVLIGAPAGTLIGLIIGANYDNNHPGYLFNAGKPIGALVGALAGALVGSMIGGLFVREETINLKDIREVDRQNELKNFLRNNSNF